LKNNHFDTIKTTLSERQPLILSVSKKKLPLNLSNQKKSKKDKHFDSLSFFNFYKYHIMPYKKRLKTNVKYDDIP